jgi:hypothetical protein
MESKEEKKLIENVKNKSLFHYLDPDNPSCYLFVGKSYSGKSHFIRFLLLEMLKKKVFALGLVFTGSSFNSDFDFLDKKYIVDGWKKKSGRRR